jgi:hypothetical protein
MLNKTPLKVLSQNLFHAYYMFVFNEFYVFDNN